MVHKTFRGKIIDMETIRRKNEESVAVGNMGVNARGDKLGPGGHIVTPVQQKARRHHQAAVSTETVSIKGDMPADEEVVLDEQPVVKVTKKKAKTKERETTTGDIVIEDDTDESSSIK